MYRKRFFLTTFGRAALVSIFAMVVMNGLATARHVHARPVIEASPAAITGEPA